ncbi:MAG: hypothetical protein ABII71_04020 [Candidatus Micrarchaeota archaeon]
MARANLDRNEKTVVALLGALGLIILLGGVLLGYYSFTLGFVLAFSFWVLAGVIKIMKGGKREIGSIMGLLGLVVLFIGLFTDLYDFNLGLFGALAIWILSGVVATYLGAKK